MLSAPILRSSRHGRVAAVAAIAALGLTACAGQDEQVQADQRTVELDRVAQVEKDETAKGGDVERQADAGETEAEKAAAEKAEAEKAAEQAQKRKVYEYRRAKKARIEEREAQERAAAEAARQEAAKQAWAEKVAEREAAQKAWAEKVARERAEKQKAAEEAWAEKVAEQKAAEERAAAEAAQQRAAVERTASTTLSGSVWDRLAYCETGGDWSMNSGNGFYGGIQFKQDVWVANGGTQYAPMPHMASREEQIIMGKKIHATAGWGAWPGCQAKLGLY